MQFFVFFLMIYAPSWKREIERSIPYSVYESRKTMEANNATYTLAS